MDKRIFNVIPGADRSCCMLLYGYIGEHEEVRSADVVKELMEAEASYSKIDVRINSYGGEVHTGVAIFSALRNSKADITIYVDGVAASIAAIVALCGKPLHMGKYSRLMIHSARGGCWGTKSDMKQAIADLESVEGVLAGILASKTGKSEDEIKSAYFDDKDHWLTAAEAKQAGLADFIFDTDPVPEASTPEQVYNIFMNRLEVKPNNNTMIEELKKRPTFANCTSEADVIKNIATLEAKAEKADGLEQTNKTLQQENETLKAAAAEALKAENTKIVNAAFDAGRISEPEKAIYMKALEGDDRQDTIKVLEALPMKRRIENSINKDDPGDGKSPFEARKEEVRNKTGQ